MTIIDINAPIYRLFAIEANNALYMATSRESLEAHFKGNFPSVRREISATSLAPITYEEAELFAEGFDVHAVINLV